MLLVRVKYQHVVLYPAIHTPLGWLSTRPCVTQKQEVLNILTENHPAQSSEDTVQKACMSQSSTLSACISLSCAFGKAFTFEKHSSMGFRSWEYGGIKWTRAPILWKSEITPSVWWIEALSMRRMLCGSTPLKGSKCGRTLFSRKSKNTSSSTDPVVVYTSNIPLSPIVPIAETRFPQQSNCMSWHVYLWNLRLQGYSTMREIMC